MGIKDWNKKKTTSTYNLSAPTIYETEGYKIWKGRYYVISIISSADEWHLQRLSDNQIIYSARTAKECMEAFDNGVR